MAREFFESVEVWLPAEFLCDEIVRRGVDKGGAGGGKIRRIPFGFAGNVDHPEEAVARTEQWKEDEDHMARLTKQMTHYFLQDDDLDAANKSKAMAGSAVSSPLAPSPTELWRKGNDLGDLLHEAAAQAMRLRQISCHDCLRDRGFLVVSNKISPATTAPKKADFGNYGPKPVLTPEEELQAGRFSHLSRQQSIKQQLSAAWHKQQKASANGGFYGESRHCRPPDLPVSAWTPLGKPLPSLPLLPPPSHPGSGMSAAFLGAATGRKESVGTGVFIPRTAGNKLEAKKIAGFSTALMPEKVAQALNQNKVSVAAPPRFTGGLLNSDAFVGRGSAVMSHHRRPYQKLSAPSPSPPLALAVGAGAHETRLPQEWTY